ncbi:MAG TPA: pyridoxal phosphate-dependent aminotransferase [Brevefilum fermentans]|mgnify:CR=1 FL=1|jgi:aminotransferase|uniref:Aminotransferase n=1 Tax=Candidatus Brevifilum fermentans TaxID=1986204 RepID=A0A1Y6K0U6_9CHLR|nr:pyridoxal phosphate-dependent aminotransferase [Brevefilum fermentans]MDI9565320.1 pyridoxal phosphate-dependent aminotransferase [Chloroflexota bacterium]OQB88138.1 MAG: Aspartate aminotransferase [Chloroflexi bacterium ADurb.Bin120]SMX53312.1 Aspartate aminotransferase [Brevefilum fermentans]HOM67980.1 pyridoxal phosphate-dependent aminotransferase [Brevefilum fermentans]HPX95275.1 pyridoxal phosphate-dependent aminotransferase [Brevefilum fermentans]
MAKRYLSRTVKALKPSGIRKFFDIAATMKDVISLGIGEPDFTTPQPIIDAGIHALQKGETHYTSNAGILQLRQAIAENLERLYGVRYDPVSEIIITVGVSEALYLTFSALLDPGDEVIIPTPCFVSYQAEVELAGGVPVEVYTNMEDDFQPDPALIAKAITPKTKAILLSYPCNPSGAVASRERLLAIADLAKQHDLLVVSDEIYDRLVYGVEHVCFPALPGMQDRTVLLGGFSKSYAMTGWRVGYAAGPADVIGGLVRIHQYSVMSAPTVSQYAAIEALRIGEPYVQEMLAEYDRRRKMIHAGMNELGLDTFEPHGAFYVFPNVINTGLDDETFAERLLKEEGVAVVPGSAFGDAGAGFVRCSYATSYEKIEQALEKIDRFVKKL